MVDWETLSPHELALTANEKIKKNGYWFKSRDDFPCSGGNKKSEKQVSEDVVNYMCQHSLGCASPGPKLKKYVRIEIESLYKAVLKAFGSLWKSKITSNAVTSGVKIESGGDDVDLVVSSFEEVKAALVLGKDSTILNVVRVYQAVYMDSGEVERCSDTFTRKINVEFKILFETTECKEDHLTRLCKKYALENVRKHFSSKNSSTKGGDKKRQQVTISTRKDAGSVSFVKSLLAGTNRESDVDKVKDGPRIITLKMKGLSEICSHPDCSHIREQLSSIWGVKNHIAAGAAQEKKETVEASPFASTQRQTDRKRKHLCQLTRQLSFSLPFLYINSHKKHTAQELCLCRRSLHEQQLPDP